MQVNLQTEGVTQDLVKRLVGRGRAQVFLGDAFKDLPAFAQGSRSQAIAIQGGASGALNRPSQQSNNRARA